MGIESFFSPGTPVLVIGFREPPEEVSECLLGGNGPTPAFAFRGFTRRFPFAEDVVTVGIRREYEAIGGTPITPYAVGLANALKDVGLLLRSAPDSEDELLTYLVVRIDRADVERDCAPENFVASLLQLAITTLRAALKPPN